LRNGGALGLDLVFGGFEFFDLHACASLPEPGIGAAARCRVRYACQAAWTVDDEIGSPGACDRTAAPRCITALGGVNSTGSRGSVAGAQEVAVDDRSVSQSCLSSRKVSYPFLSGRTATNPVQPLPTQRDRSQPSIQSREDA
jgi:hypothetical protein